MGIQQSINSLPYKNGTTRAFTGFMELDQTVTPNTYNSFGELNIYTGFNKIALRGAPTFAVNINYNVYGTNSLTSEMVYGDIFVLIVQADGNLVAAYFANMSYIHGRLLFQWPLTSACISFGITLPAGEYYFAFWYQKNIGNETTEAFSELSAAIVVQPQRPQCLPCSSMSWFTQVNTIFKYSQNLINEITMYVLTSENGTEVYNASIDLPGFRCAHNSTEYCVVADALCNSGNSNTSENFSYQIILNMSITSTNSLPISFEQTAKNHINKSFLHENSCTCGDVKLMNSPNAYVIATGTLEDDSSAFGSGAHMNSIVSYRTFPCINNYPAPFVTKFECTTTYVIPAPSLHDYRVVLTMPGQPVLELQENINSTNMSITLDSAPYFVVTLDLFCDVLSDSLQDLIFISGDVSLRTYDTLNLFSLHNTYVHYGANINNKGIASFATSVTVTVPAGTYFPVANEYVQNINSLPGQRIKAKWLLRIVAIPVS